MHLSRLRIQNFRSIENIDVEFDGLINVIVGPNAIGKTTILESIRLTKALLAPRTQGEAIQTMISLGASSPHLPQRLFPKGLTRRQDTPLVVKCTYSVEKEELDALTASVPQMAATLAQQSVGQSFANPNQSAAFFSSPQGQQLLKGANQQLASELDRVKTSNIIELNISIDFSTGIIAGEHVIQQLFYSALEQRLEPGRALFSYFPADRAMPIGDQPVQLGASDSAQQLESYNSQPQLKYQRLKNLIFNAIIGGASGRKDIEDNFEAIFSRILKGRSLGEIGVNEIGMLSIPIIDKDSGCTFDIDGLSSGEKGLILTFLLIGKSVSKNGLILLDEPELHLNPAVCRDILQFLADEFAEKHNIQAIICSHSAEILAGAFERSCCSLFHLRGGSLLAKVRQHDRGEIRDALRRLGSSESEALLYKGSISVEGIHDAEVLRAGFDGIFRRYKLKQLGGRGIIERDIKELQNAEKNGDDIGFHFFIFDHDGRPANFSNSEHVRILQLDRFCLENYLLDNEIITDLSRNRRFSDRELSNVTETRNILREIALEQVSDVAARSVFKELGLEGICFDMNAVSNQDPRSVASDLMKQIDAIKNIIASIESRGFQGEFERLYIKKRKEIFEQWGDEWCKVCNGKRLFESLRLKGYVKGDLLSLKKQIANEMSVRQTETWRSLESFLQELIKGS